MCLLNPFPVLLRMAYIKNDTSCSNQNQVGQGIPVCLNEEMTACVALDKSRMKVAVDVHYSKDDAVAAGVLFQNWADSEVLRELVVSISPVAEYQPGELYKRELPCILALLDQLEVLPVCIIVDGYVYLDDAQRPGLGKHLHDALKGKVPVIGVAKSLFKNAPTDSAVFRAKSNRPLYVTAVGLDDTEAKGYILQMHGRYRLPTMLRRADQLSRGHID
jgi:deoxyribonuclease V